jgi:acetyl-CoA synthetase
MSEQKIYPVPEAFKRQTLMDRQTYDRWYQQSIDDPDTFWAERADQLLDWQTRWDTVSDWDFKEGRAAWFQGGKLNACYNCVDRHLPERAQQTAIIWEGDEPDQEKHITYQELFEQVSRFANALKDRGVKKGDRVVIYMPMIPEAAYAMLACARIGAIHSVVFGGFSPEALKDRIQNAGACALITADEGVRGGKVVALKANADKALSGCLFVTGRAIDLTSTKEPRDGMQFERRLQGARVDMVVFHGIPRHFYLNMTQPGHLA